LALATTIASWKREQRSIALSYLEVNLPEPPLTSQADKKNIISEQQFLGTESLCKIFQVDFCHLEKEKIIVRSQMTLCGIIARKNESLAAS